MFAPDVTQATQTGRVCLLVRNTGEGSQTEDTYVHISASFTNHIQYAFLDCSFL